MSEPMSNEHKEVYDILSRISDKLNQISKGIAKMEDVTSNTLDRIEKLTRHVEKTSARLILVEKMQEGWHDIVSLLQTIEGQVAKAETKLSIIEEHLDQKTKRLDMIETRLYNNEEVIQKIEKKLVYSTSV